MKAIVQLIGAVLTAALPLLIVTDDLDITEWINVGVVAAGAAAVYITANLAVVGAHPIWRYTKAIMSALAAAGVVLISALADNVIGQAEWWQIAAAVLTVLGVVAAPGPVVTGTLTGRRTV